MTGATFKDPLLVGLEVNACYGLDRQRAGLQFFQAVIDQLLDRFRGNAFAGADANIKGGNDNSQFLALAALPTYRKAKRRWLSGRSCSFRDSV